MTNTELIEYMEEKGEIAYGLEKGNQPVTLNDLIDFCKKEKIDFNTPIFLNCPDGYFPLAYYYNGMAQDGAGNDYTLGILVIDDGN